MNPLAVHGMLVCRVHGKDHDLQKTISVAWLRNTGSPAGLKPKAVPEACAEMLSK